MPGRRYDTWTDTCSSAGCEQATHCRGLCSSHYMAWYNRAKRQQRPSQGACSVVGCAREAVKRRHCDPHYQMLRKHGDPLGALRAGAGAWTGVQCKEPECREPAVCRAFCQLHYDRHRRTRTDVKARQRRSKRRYRATPRGKAMGHSDSVRRRLGTRAGGASIADVAALLDIAEDCGICGRPLRGDKSIDHIIPLTRGGDHRLENLQIAHRSCNSKKKNRLPHEVRL